MYAGGKYQIGAGLVHYDGRGWTDVTPAPWRYPPMAVDAVWANSRYDVFLSGLIIDRSKPNGLTHNGWVAHGWGSSWEFTVLPTHYNIVDLWGSGPDNLYALAYDRVFHFDGRTWQPVDLGPGITRELTAIWGSGPEDIYVVGRWGLVLHYDGENWARLGSPGSGYTAVGGSGPADVYVVGSRHTILHRVSGPPDHVTVRDRQLVGSLTPDTRVPVTVAWHGAPRTGVAFALDYDPECFALDPADADGDGLADAVHLRQAGGVTFGPGSDSTLPGHVAVVLAATAAALTDGALVEVDLTPTRRCGGEQVVDVWNVVAQDGAGHSVAGAGRAGVITLPDSALYLPMVAVAGLEAK